MKPLVAFSFLGKLMGGKVVPDHPKYVRGTLALFQDAKIRVSVERLRGGKSAAQLGYLYGHLYEVMSISTGYSVSDLDRAMKAKHLNGKVVWRGVEYTTPKGKSDLLNDEMSEFIMSVYEEALELGLSVFPPDKEWRVKEQFPESYPPR